MENKYKNLEREIKNRWNKHKEERLKQSIEEKRSYTGKKYKYNEETKLNQYIEKYFNGFITEELNQLKEVSQAEDFNTELILTIEWTNSRTWGKNPRVNTNFGFEGGSISGCGYCKLSTATAEGLNSHMPLLKLMYDMKEKYLKEHKNIIQTEEHNKINHNEINHNKINHNEINHNSINKKLFGYGSGYNVLPRFEGGVGVSSHENIIKNLELEMRNITSTSNTDVYIIRKVKKEGGLKC